MQAHRNITLYRANKKKKKKNRLFPRSRSNSVSSLSTSTSTPPDSPQTPSHQKEGMLSRSDHNLETLPAEMLGARLVRLSRNRISELPTSLVERCVTLEELAIAENSLQELPDVFFTLPQLRVLDARRNRITGISSAIESATRLEKIFLGGNRLSKLPKNVDWSKLVSLKTLSLRENQIKSLPEKLTGVTSLEHLDVSRNKLSRLPSMTFAQLSFFDGSFNQITDLDDGFFEGMPSLRTFNFSQNQLLALPPSLATLSLLETLDVDENPLGADMSINGAGCSSLQTVRMCRCRLSAIPNWLGSAPALVELFLSGNDLTNLGDVLSSSTSLTSLDVSDNQINVLDGESLPTSLLTLVISSNAVEQFGKSFEKLGNLKKLDLSKNSIYRVLRNGMPHLKSLHTLSLEANGLPSIDGLELLPAITSLDISSNELEMLPEELTSWHPTIEILHLERNRLVDLPNDILGCQKMKQLFLDENPFSNIPSSIPRNAQKLVEYVAMRKRQQQ